MNKMAEFLKGLEDTWNQEEYEAIGHNHALTELACLLEVSRKVLAVTGLTPEQAFGNIQVFTALIRGAADATGLPFEAMWGFLTCVVLVEIERRNG